MSDHLVPRASVSLQPPNGVTGGLRRRRLDQVTERAGRPAKRTTSFSWPSRKPVTLATEPAMATNNPTPINGTASTGRRSTAAAPPHAAITTPHAEAETPAKAAKSVVLEDEKERQPGGSRAGGIDPRRRVRVRRHDTIPTASKAETRRKKANATNVGMEEDHRTHHRHDCQGGLRYLAAFTPWR